MLAPPGATVAVVVFPAPASDVLVSLPPMLAPPGATVVVVVLCDKQSDCMSAVVVVPFVPVAVGPNDVPLGASLAAVSLPPAPVACTGLVGATDIDVSTSKTAGKAIVA